MNTPDPALGLVEVAVERAGVRVLEDVNLRIPAGAIMALVGPSGVGKTSLLRCMNGLDRPTGGMVRLQGVDAAKINPRELRRRVAMIFQVPVLFGGSVADNLEYGLGSPDRDRTFEVLQAVGLDSSFAERAARALSVGQAQRVCLARALVRRPEILLMDEPTSSLDKDAGAVIEALVAELRDDGMTVVFVTHDLRQARRIADSAALLGRGRLQYVGDPDAMDDLWEEHA